MEVSYERRVKSITFDDSRDLFALVDVFEAASKWIEFGTVNGHKSVMESPEQRAAMKQLIIRVFNVFDVGEED